MRCVMFVDDELQRSNAINVLQPIAQWLRIFQCSNAGLRRGAPQVVARSLELTSTPPAPDRESSVVTQLEHVVALFHLGGENGVFPAEGNSRALHLDLVFRLDLHVLVLEIPTRTQMDRYGLLVRLHVHVKSRGHPFLKRDLGHTNDLSG